MEAQVNFTAVFEAAEGGFIAYIEEFPGVNTQGETIEEARENLLDALNLYLETTEQENKTVIKESIRLVA